MGGVLLVLLALVGIAAVGALVAFLVALARKGQERYERQGQVVPGQPSEAPAEWAGAHSREAKLHRRLGAAMQALQVQARSADEDVTALELRVELEQHALAVDRRLIAAAALPAGERRDQALAEIEVSVAAVESATADLAAASGQRDASADVRRLEDLSARIKGMTAEG
ncbi:hypothetical protein [Euzebya sp.]|uniref:hypothetical protein n=1 Tax=Euzebya sp. TaxID=1971409 RepID=UPI0035176647